MIKVFYGEDRVRAKQEIEKYLGEKYEVVEGEELSPEDLPSVMLGASLFEAERAILVRDFLNNKVVAEKLSEYLNTPHKIAIWETKIDKRSGIYKALKDEVPFCEFKLLENKNAKVVFDIFGVAKKDGKKAVKMLETIEKEQDPIRFVGLMATQAMKDYGIKQGKKEKKILKELSELDLKLKSTKIEPWLLVKAFLLRIISW